METLLVHGRNSVAPLQQQMTQVVHNGFDIQPILAAERQLLVMCEQNLGIFDTADRGSWQMK